jgi:hypothetical protein
MELQAVGLRLSKFIFYYNASFQLAISFHKIPQGIALGYINPRLCPDISKKSDWKLLKTHLTQNSGISTEPKPHG